MHVFTEIRRITSALGLAQSVRDRSCDLFRTAQKEDLIHGRTLEGFAAACVYATCRCMGLPWERDEFKTVARCPPGRVDAAYDAMNQNLELPLQPLPAKSFVPRYATELDVGDSVRQEAEELAEQADESRTINCAPGSVAGAALYLASLGTAYELTQTQVAAVAECTPNTIRCRSRDLRDLRDA
jgi:transcription initiation factor TFIIB